MKLTNKLVEKFGYDKLLHFLLSGWLTQIGTLANWWVGLLVIAIIIGLSYCKEKMWDTIADNKDIYAAIIGCSIAYLLSFVI